MPQFRLASVPSGDTTIASIQDENNQLIGAYNRGQLNIDPNEDHSSLIFREGNIIRHTIALDDIISPAISGRDASQYIVEELGFFFRALSVNNNGGNGEVFNLSGAFNPTELLTLALTGSQGSNSSIDIQFARIGQTLIVSPLGDDNTATRESIRNHFSSLSAAVNAAQSGDTILVLGQQAITSTILISNKELAIVCLGANFEDTTLPPLFQLTNATVIVTGNYSINRPEGSLAQLLASSKIIFEGFNQIKLRSGVSVNASSKAIIRNGNSFSISTTGGGGVVNSCQDASEILFDHIMELSCTAANFSSVNDSAKITLQYIDNFSFNGDRICNNIGAVGKGYFTMRNVSHSQINGIGTTTLSTGAIAGVIDIDIISSKIDCNARFIASAATAITGAVTIKDSTINCNAETPIRVSGSLVCRNTRISTLSPTPVIEYTQSNALHNEIVSCRLENSNGHTLLFTGNATSQKLTVHNNQLSGGFQEDDQLIASNNVMITGEEVDLGATTAPTMTIDFSLGSVFFITLTQDVTLVFENVFHGKDYSIIFLQDAVGNHDVTLPAACEFPSSAPHPSFNFPADFVVKMQLRLERVSDSYHCTFNQFSS